MSDAAAFRVEITAHAAKTLRRLPRADQLRIAGAIELLADNPRPPACIALAGANGVYRVRVGDYRVVYEIQDRHLIVYAIRSGHRRDVYRP